ncbi:MAG: hypothetical protein AAF389_17340 [Gemmatimonadota bacterium]
MSPFRMGCLLMWEFEPALDREWSVGLGVVGELRVSPWVSSAAAERGRASWRSSLRGFISGYRR